jgi:hypothetical protein
VRAVLAELREGGPGGDRRRRGPALRRCGSMPRPQRLAGRHPPGAGPAAGRAARHGALANEVKGAVTDALGARAARARGARLVRSSGASTSPCPGGRDAGHIHPLR